MRYYGDFRSLDHSVDKKGQKYRVLIFTGYDPTASGRNHTGPYPWKRKRQLSIPGQVNPYVYYPDKGTELTMTDSPFVVKYAGDTNDLYKPYRCSTASVSFLQSSLNQDFINALGQSVMVVLLKWNNDVYESNSYTMKNVVTGESITKQRYEYEDQASQRSVTLYYDYNPWEYDKFCYDVEWVGFTTPTMLNVEYDHIVDAFVLECQDALSTLQYTEFVRTAQMEDMLMTLFRMLATLGTYRDIYLTTAIHLPADNDDLNTRIPTTGNALRWIAHQQDNMYNEDGQPFKYLEILENMLSYLNLTAIPYQDKLYIVNGVALGNGHTTYNHYQFESDNDILPWILPNELTSNTPTTMSDVSIVDTVVLNKESFCGGTQISSDSMYNKVTVQCDEMRPEPLLPEVDNEENFMTETSIMNQPLAKNVWSRYVTSTPGQYENEDFHYFEAYFNRPAIDEIKFYRYFSGNCLNTVPYTHPVTNWSYQQLEVTDDDLIVLHNSIYPSGPNSYGYMERLKGIANSWADTETTYWWSYMSNMAMLIDFSDTTVGSTTEVPTTVSFHRNILLATPMNGTNIRKLTGAGVGDRAHDWDDKSLFWNPMLYMKSKPFLGNGKQYLNIDGSFTFYGSSSGNGDVSWWPVPQQSRSSSYFKFDSNHNYLWVKIKCGAYYLSDSGRGQYSWVDYDTPCRIWCDNASLSQNDDWRFKNFDLETNIRGVNGITVKLPVMSGYAEPMQLEIWFERPIGPGSDGSWCPASTLINDLSVNIYSDEYVESRKRRNPDRDNTEYNNEVVEGAIEEYPEVSLVHSSCDTAGLSYSETARHTIRRRTQNEHVWKTNQKVMSDGDGYFGLPEEVRVRGLKHHLITPTVTIQTDLFNKLTPISRVKWGQLGDKQFVVDSMSINYEYEQCDVNLMEVKEPSTVTEYGGVFRVNITRNYHRTRDLMFDGHVARRFPIELGTSTPQQYAGSSNGQIVNEDNEVLWQDAPGESCGAVSIDGDWGENRLRLNVPSSGGVSARNVNGGVIITTM